jgi:hypothetical protein
VPVDVLLLPGPNCASTSVANFVPTLSSLVLPVLRAGDAGLDQEAAAVQLVPVLQVLPGLAPPRCTNVFVVPVGARGPRSSR